MGALACYLQKMFRECCPSGWTCDSEVEVLDSRLAKLFGYTPRADVVLERVDGTRRLWIEFEVSRADPVANHAKFATAHLFQRQRPNEAFVSMVSSHVARGRRNLAANTIHLMRHIGMSAFQTTLLPTLPPDAIHRVNLIGVEALAALDLNPQQEIERAMRVSEPLAMTAKYRVFFVSDLLEVICNLQSWNRAVSTDAGRTLWGRRRVRYFVFDPATRLFAPSKFCAFRPIPCDAAGTESPGSIMTLEFYATLGEDDPRFDGSRAWRHLQQLGMSVRPVADESDLVIAFNAWLAGTRTAIEADAENAIVLSPPAWFT